jgi:predicted phosphoribosyltransferase
VPVDYEVARDLEALLDLVLVRKTGTPWQPELAIAPVVDGGRPEIVVIQEIVDKLKIPLSYSEKQATIELEKLERHRARFLADRPAYDLLQVDRTGCWRDFLAVFEERQGGHASDRKSACNIR